MKTKIILVSLAFLFGVLLIITTLSTYKLTCLIKKTKSVPVTGIGMLTRYARVNTVYCTMCDYNSMDEKVTFTIHNKNLDTNTFYNCLKEYNRIIVKKFILQVNNVVRTKESIQFEGSKVSDGALYFSPLTAYATLPTITNVGNSILWVVHMSSSI